MRKPIMAIGVLAGSLLASGNVAAQQPGYVYDTYGKPAKDTWGECVKSVYREKDAYPECEQVAKAPVIQKERATLDGKTHFDFDKSNLKPAGKQTLDDLVGRLKGAEIQSVSVVGHTDSIGSEAYNQRLGQRRAETVKGYLADRGIPASKISTSSMGETQPVADNRTADGRAMNRRAEVDVTAVRK
jgi:OOP family OmpA-OmpF porin